MTKLELYEELILINRKLDEIESSKNKNRLLDKINLINRKDEIVNQLIFD